MIYSVAEYSKKFLYKGREVSIKTITRKCENGLLPTGHFAKKLSGGWVIEVTEEAPFYQEKPKPRQLGRSYFNIR